MLILSFPRPNATGFLESPTKNNFMQELHYNNFIIKEYELPDILKTLFIPMANKTTIRVVKDIES